MMTTRRHKFSSWHFSYLEVHVLSCDTCISSIFVHHWVKGVWLVSIFTAVSISAGSYSALGQKSLFEVPLHAFFTNDDNYNLAPWVLGLAFQLLEGMRSVVWTQCDTCISSVSEYHQSMACIEKDQFRESNILPPMHPKKIPPNLNSIPNKTST